MARGGVFKAMAGAAMLGLTMSMPALGASRPPSFVERQAPEYDGLGRKRRRKYRPEAAGKRGTREWREFCRKVVSTHRYVNGVFQDDPRDDKYLHSGARGMRGLRTALAKSDR